MWVPDLGLAFRARPVQLYGAQTSVQLPLGADCSAPGNRRWYGPSKSVETSCHPPNDQSALRPRSLEQGVG
eukprot:3579412-Prymnesium_polylepis.1